MALQQASGSRLSKRSESILPKGRFLPCERQTSFGKYSVTAGLAPRVLSPRFCCYLASCPNHQPDDLL